MNVRDKYQRLTCGCEVCRVGCKTMPGNLAVGDFERIAEHLGKTDGESATELLLDNFVVSDGAVVGVDTPQGYKYVQLPLITPRQQPNGHCVFLREGQCSIHAVSPFGCSHFDCEQPIEEADRRSHDCLSEIIQSVTTGGSYGVLMDVLDDAGRHSQTTIFDRRKEFERRIAIAKLKREPVHAT